MSQNIASVDRALDILLLLYGTGQEMGVTEIADRLGIYKSTVHRTLQTLQDKDFVHQNESNGRYWLGTAFLTIGMLVQERYSLADLVAPEALSLNRDTNEGVNVSVLHHDPINGYRSVVIYKVETKSQILSIDPPLGSSMDAYVSSVGKCLMAHTVLDDAYLIGYQYEAYTPNSITNFDALMTELNQVKEQGYAIDNEERELGLFCIGAPILNRNGDAIAAISISGPKSRLKDDHLEEKIERVKKAAFRISENIKPYQI